MRVDGHAASTSMSRLDVIVAAADDGEFVTFDSAEFEETISGIATIRDQLAQQIVTDAESEADALAAARPSSASGSRSPPCSSPC